jgi:hypothetical protein
MALGKLIVNEPPAMPKERHADEDGGGQLQNRESVARRDNGIMRENIRRNGMFSIDVLGSCVEMGFEVLERKGIPQGLRASFCLGR